MQQFPKKTKYKKYRKGRFRPLEYKSNVLKFGFFGLKAEEPGVLKFKQIEAARRAVTRSMNRQGKVWIRVFPDIPVFKKSKGARMGKGKGSLSHWVAKVRAGTVILEVSTEENPVNVMAGLRTASMKMPIKARGFYL